MKKLFLTKIIILISSLVLFIFIACSCVNKELYKNLYELNKSVNYLYLCDSPKICAERKGHVYTLEGPTEDYKYKYIINGNTVTKQEWLGEQQLGENVLSDKKEIFDLIREIQNKNMFTDKYFIYDANNLEYSLLPKYKNDIKVILNLYDINGDITNLLVKIEGQNKYKINFIFNDNEQIEYIVQI